jgi:prepilin-type N-terminal cleavage/methylation domain-containing protein
LKCASGKSACHKSGKAFFPTSDEMKYCVNQRSGRNGCSAGGPGAAVGIRRRGVTLLELLVVLTCLAVAAAIVMPVALDGAPTQVRGAADLLIADLEYARSESMSNADDPRLIVFDPAGKRYHVARRSSPTVPVKDPVGLQGYTTEYGSGRAASLPKVKVGSYSLGGDNRLMFRGLGELDQTEPARIILSAGTHSVTITLDPITGEATIGDLAEPSRRPRPWWWW